METKSNDVFENNPNNLNDSSNYLLEERFPHQLFAKVVSVQAFLNEMLKMQNELISVLNLMELNMVDIMQPINEVILMENQVDALDETIKKFKEKINDCFEHDLTASIPYPSIE